MLPRGLPITENILPIYNLDYSNSKLPSIYRGFLQGQLWRSTHYVLAQEGHVSIYLTRHYTIGSLMCTLYVQGFCFSVRPKLCFSVLAVNHWWFCFEIFSIFFLAREIPAPACSRIKSVKERSKTATLQRKPKFSSHQFGTSPSRSRWYRKVSKPTAYLQKTLSGRARISCAS